MTSTVPSEPPANTMLFIVLIHLPILLEMLTDLVVNCLSLVEVSFVGYSIEYKELHSPTIINEHERVFGDYNRVKSSVGTGRWIELVNV